MSRTQGSRKRHETTRTELVPFVAELLGEGPMRERLWALPPDLPDVLAEDTAAALPELVIRGLWRRLCQDGGWLRQSFASAGGEELSCRLWESPAVQAAPLRFTPGAFELLVLAYDLCCRSPAPRRELDAALAGLSLQSNGDLLLGAVAFSRLQHLPASPAWLEIMGQNPLCLMAHFHRFPPIEPPGSLLPRLLEPDLAPFLPWLGRAWRRAWRRHEPLRWTSAEALVASSRRQGALLDHWMELLEQRGALDGLVPLLDGLAELAAGLGGAEGIASRLGALPGAATLLQRQAAARQWSAATLRPARRLGEIRSRTQRLHPADREAPERLFLAAYTSRAFDATIEALEQGIRAVLPVLG
jgi:hypothetical protein